MRAFPLLLLLAACGASVSGGDEGGEKKEDAAPKVDPRTLVEVAPVTRGAVGDHVVSSAVVESESQAAVVPEATGPVTGLYVEEGDAVKQGQLLAVLASPQLDAAYQRATTELENATAQAESAQRLFGQGALSKAELDVAQHALDVARTAHEEASKTRGYTRLEAPIDGTVATRNLRFGEVAGPTPAFTIVDLSRLRVVVSLPERELQRIRDGLEAHLASTYDDKEIATARVVRVAPVIDAVSGTFKATLALDPGQNALRPGQFVRVRIEVDRHADVLTVPRRALVWEEGKPWVFTVAEMTAEEVQKEKDEADKKKAEAKPKGLSFDFGKFGQKKEDKEEELPGPRRKATRVPLSLGYLDGESAEVVSGVTEGQQVVVVGNAALRDGARVRLPGDPTVTRGDDEKDAAADGAAKTEGQDAG